VGFGQAILHRIGLAPRRQVEELRASIPQIVDEAIRRANPVWTSIAAERGRGGAGTEPLDQDYTNFLATSGSFPWFTAARDAISISTSQRRLVLKRRKADGSSEEVTGPHPIKAIIANPNPDDGEFSFRRQISDMLLLTGEAPLTAVPQTPGQVAMAWKNPKEIYVQRADRLKPILAEKPVEAGKASQTILAYVYDGPGGRVQLHVGQVIVIKEPNPTDPIRGLAPAAKLSATLPLEYYARRWAKNFFVGGGQIPTIIGTKEPLQDADFTRFSKMLDARAADPRNIGRPLMVNGDGVVIKTFGVDPEDALIENLLALTCKEQLAVLHCPPFIVSLLEHANWSNSNEQMKSFLTNAVMPHARLIESTLSASAFVLSHGDDLFLEHEFKDECLQENFAEKSTASKAYYEVGALSPDEIRERDLGLPKRDDGNGGEYKSTVTMDPLGVGDPEDEEEDESGDPGDETKGKNAPSKRTRGMSNRDVLWAAVSAIRAPGERVYAGEVRDLLRGLKRDVMHTVQGWGHGPLPPNAASIDLFDAKTQAHEWAQRLFPIALRAAKMGKRRFVGKRRSDGEYVVVKRERAREPSKKLTAYAAKRTNEKVKTILDTQKEAAAKVVAAAIENEATIAELSTDLRGFFDDNEAMFATRIARTEAAAIMNAAAVEGISEAGFQTKEWLASRDADVRESHEDIDGAQVGIGEDFVLQGGRGPWPGEIDAPEESINCRCAVVVGDA